MPPPQAAVGAETLQNSPCECLPQYDWYTKHTTMVLEVVPRQTWGEYSLGGGEGCTEQC